MKKRIQISELCDIRFGFYSQPDTAGTVAYLQARQFNDDGRQIAAPDEYIQLDEKVAAHILKDDDVLFVGKGNRLFAWCYKYEGQPAVASSIFFVLRPHTHIIYPQYLAAILNTPLSKAAFSQIGGGTNILSIRKSELGAFEVPVPSMKQQKSIAALTQLYQQEIELTEQLIIQKRKIYTAIISKLTK
ncbi:restriction endonuclease subunit S [Chitinophaga agri]|uniref:Restriction endonuclease subunit S n=1 Tax=Chitinophaga agri TaxID=2703787 RepID=A0A6B9ZFB0_9BACT|nr:restriction endonuclease subunit S [Chitinophaga agri]QHS61068.1 restriction endonuclease subunit S [Chitinophaga agri]